MKFQIKLTLLFLFTAFSTFAQKKALESITQNELKAHLEFIASDYMQGRDFGTTVPGVDLTADYLKTQCMQMELKPGVTNFFQIVEMVSVKQDTENTFFKVTDSNGAEKYQTNDIFTFGGTSENDTLKGDIIFCGYGWYNDETKYNDTEGLIIKDKIVLIMTRNLEAALDTSKKNIDTNQEMKKINKALMGGAKALVFVPDPLNTDTKWFDMIRGYFAGGSYTLKGSKPSSTIPVRLIFGTEALANEILKESGKTLLQLQNEINSSGTPKSFDLKDCKAEIQLVKKTKTVEGKNVVAILEGSDPVLKNECVVLSAHYDHIGIAANGDVNNGADDNGSGTVGLLEVAEAFTKMKTHPKRSIVFAWVTAEEKGLFGSDFYSQHPVFPLGKTLANINLDMIGRSAEKELDAASANEENLSGPNGIFIESGKQSSELIKISNEICKELNLNPTYGSKFINRSDHYHFYKHGIPVLGVTTGLHEDYHQPSDELDKIDYNKMKRVADYVFLVTLKVADQKKRIVVDNPVKK